MANQGGDKVKVIVVVGATGQQGNSVVKAMKDDKNFIIKAATRNTQSKEAKQLAAEGVQVIQLDMFDPASCNEALKGAYGVFLVTPVNFKPGFPMLSTPFDLICVSDAGEVTHQVFLRPDEFMGQWIYLASDSATVEQYANILTKKFPGKKFVASNTTPEQFAQFPFPGAKDLAVMFQFFLTGKCPYHVEETRKLHPKILTFEQWVEKSCDALEASWSQTERP